MSGWIGYQELHRYFPIEHGVASKIIAEMEREPIDTCLQGFPAGQQLRNAASRVGNAFARNYEVAVRRNVFRGHPHALRRYALSRIENVRTDSIHAVSSFSSRSRVILFCSSAATRISWSGKFAKRDRKIVSISSALFPLADTMKM